jgi:hypothetical protein
VSRHHHLITLSGEAYQPAIIASLIYFSVGSGEQPDVIRPMKSMATVAGGHRLRDVPSVKKGHQVGVRSAPAAVDNSAYTVTSKVDWEHGHEDEGKHTPQLGDGCGALRLSLNEHATACPVARHACGIVSLLARARPHDHMADVGTVLTAVPTGTGSRRREWGLLCACLPLPTSRRREGCRGCK